MVLFYFLITACCKCDCRKVTLMDCWNKKHPCSPATNIAFIPPTKFFPINHCHYWSGEVLDRVTINQNVLGVLTV